MSYELVKVEDVPLSTIDPLGTLELFELYKIFNQMEKVCLDNDGLGLSAVQVGLPWDMFLINRQGSFEYYINCRYEPAGDLVSSIEGCLSIKDQFGSLRRFEVQRHSSVAVTGKRLQSNNGLYLEDFSTLQTGLYAVVFQHEIDHSLGVFIKDKGKEIFIS